MPYDITFENFPAGYAVGSARKGEDVGLQYSEFTSSEDGQHFIQRLEGLPNDILAKTSGQVAIKPSQLDHMLAIVRPDKTASVYLNELPLKFTMRIARPFDGGESIYKDDIVDVESIDLSPIEIPNDCGFLFLFSAGWRRGLYYDFGPLEPVSVAREYDYEALIAQCFAHVYFQERFSLSDREWDSLFSSQWFLFNGLRNTRIDQIISHLRAGWSADELLEDIHAEVMERLPMFLESWAKHPTFEPHIEILRKAAGHFRNNDFLSCTGLLYPRIEGIMRTNFGTGGGCRIDQNTLSESAVSSKVDNPKCLLLPRRFQSYLREVYFANFDPAAGDHDVSRNTVSHGTAPSDKFNKKAALLGILITHQLFYFCETKASNSAE